VPTITVRSKDSGRISGSNKGQEQRQQSASDFSDSGQRLGQRQRDVHARRVHHNKPDLKVGGKSET